jgi:hypothetical protein
VAFYAKGITKTLIYHALSIPGGEFRHRGSQKILTGTAGFLMLDRWLTPIINCL